MAAGYGRGGRAEAIRKALNQPIRIPGSKPEQVMQPKPSYQAVGRSALLLQHASRIGLPDVVGVQDPDPVKPTIGRGRSAILEAAISGQSAHRCDPNVNVFPSSGSSASSAQSSCSSPCPTDQSMPAELTSASQSSSGSSSSCQSGLSPCPSPDQSIPSDSTTTSQSNSTSSNCKLDSSKEPVSRLQYMLECIELSKPALIRQGSKGEEIPICANYIPVHCENKGVYLYSVSFSPTVDSKPMRFHILNEHIVTIGSVRAFDGALLFLPIRLPQNKTILKSIRPTDGEEITICITLTKVLDPASCVPLYNIIFRRIMSILKLYQLQRHYYDPSKAVLIPQHKLEVWPGYVTAVNEYEGGLMMLVDVSHHVLRTDTVWDVMVDVVETTTPQNVRKVVTEKILGQVVLTRYNNRTYAIDDIMWDKLPCSTFISSSGREMTYIDYYKMHYNIEICDLDQPLLVHRPRKHARDQRRHRPREQLELICLIPELCYITGMSVDVTKDFRVMKDLSLHTRITPDQRRLALNKFCHNVNSTPDARAELEKWGLSLDMDAICLNGRVLPRDNIIFKNGPTNASTDWSQSVGREHVLVGVDLINWMILYTKQDAKRAHSFIQCVMEVSPAMGWQVARPFIMELPTDNTQCYLRAVRENLTPNIQIVVAIFPTSRDDRYNAFKQLCCVEAPVPSQVIIVSTISRKDRLRSVVQRITLQMNCKLGGELWRVNIPTSSLMVCGIDTYHSPGKKDNSVGGFVASLNSQCTQWFSVVCHQTHGQDLIDGLKMCFLRSLRKWYEVNHALPERIIIYRDGVGDGELSVVEEFEVKQLQGCFLAISDSYQPKLGMIVVQKRNNTRLFVVQDVKNTVKWSNPPPGTIVDHTITRHNMYDFYLVSQYVREGTVTPTHYVVVHDNTGWGPDFVQQLTYKMTKMYYNWTGTVRLPAPVMYAHRLAFQVGQNLKKDPSIKLCDRLFYL